MARSAKFRPPVPVICVGNFVVGGAGKTPTAIALAHRARNLGFRPGFLAPGYGGSARGPLLVTAEHRSADVGDEPLLLAAVAPTAVGRDRAASARLMLDHGINLIIMDDGFQNPSLAKDITLVCVDAGAGSGNGLVLPAGPLRAPLDVQLQRSDALLVIGDGDRAEPLVRTAARQGRSVLRAMLRPRRASKWRNTSVLAFAGIGRPAKFFESLDAAGVSVIKTAAFPDHHRYTAADASRLIADADRQGLRLVTTEKDRVRLAGEDGPLADLRQRAEAFPVALDFDNPVAIDEMIAEAGRKAATATG
ncbi:tetraacyldisaccharide 4'-kinase [Bauldia sp.]|uniref:tetraacyldisaccharide 4'-kinase n=1 Tax=Bauldia sp. TaxID=2575872 RepID=UPI003BABBB27